jgi:hypothetical protein
MSKEKSESVFEEFRPLAGDSPKEKAIQSWRIQSISLLLILSLENQRLSRLFRVNKA